MFRSASAAASIVFIKMGYFFLTFMLRSMSLTSDRKEVFYCFKDPVIKFLHHSNCWGACWKISIIMMIPSFSFLFCQFSSKNFLNSSIPQSFSVFLRFSPTSNSSSSSSCLSDGQCWDFATFFSVLKKLDEYFILKLVPFQFNSAFMSPEWDKVWSRLSSHLQPFFLAHSAFFNNFRQKYRILTRRGKSESYFIVLQQNNV